MPKTPTSSAPRKSATEPGPIYRVVPLDLQAHRFGVEIILAEPARPEQEFWLPVWVPGSYLVREFSRHVLRLEADCGGRPAAVAKIAKNRWRVAAGAGPLRVAYSVYAFDLSVRAAFLDASRGFFNPACLMLAVAGQEHLPHRVEVVPPGDAADWRVATTLAAVDCDAAGFGLRRAASYADLIDHPVEMGRLLRTEFTAGGARHEVAIAHADVLGDGVDTARLARDLKRICSAQAALFEPRSRRAPFDRYLFLVAPTADGYGGLEHPDCTALMCARSSLPHPRAKAADAAYRDFLGLCSHEYFHAWNVGRIKPRAFVPYDLERENPTTLLWLFEGFTSYYDDLMLRRADLLSPQQYLDGLARTIAAVGRTPGRAVQSLAEASRDAWIKYYRPDENSANATVSYYQLGALLALSIDLRLREQGRATLDDVMRLLWRRYGRADAPLRDVGLDEDAMPAILAEVSGLDWRGYFRRHVAGTQELPLRRQLARFGIEWSVRDDAAFDALGLAVDEQGGWLSVRRVRNGGWAEQAGLAAGDLLIALNGERATRTTIERAHALARRGDGWRIHSLRQGLLRDTTCPWSALPSGRIDLRPAAKPALAAKRLRDAWLGAAAAPK